MKSKVSIAKCKNYEENKVETAVRKTLKHIGGLSRIIKPGNKVLLKVNLLSPSEPNKAVTTHPAVVRAVIKLVKEMGAIPTIGDAPGFLFIASKNKALIKSGIKKVADEEGVEAHQFESVKNAFVATEVVNGVWLDTVFAARLVLEADVVISMPKLKTHSLTYFTGAVKNMFGIVAPKTRRAAHNLAEYEKFCGSIVDIFSIKKPQLAIMDAIVGMEDDGPRHGNIKHTGLILSSYDCISLDAVASNIIGFNPEDIYTTKLAADRGLGMGNLEEIEIVGEKISDVLVDYIKPHVRKNIPPILIRLFDRHLKIKPLLIEKKCSKCKICAKSCPAKAISLNPYPQINRGKCIECFCCNEMCPEGAIMIKKNWLAKRIKG